MRTIIKNGTIVRVDEKNKADILIENGVIQTISSFIQPKQTDKVIDANNKYVLPGGVDPHTHLSNVGQADDFLTGTKAAAVGGVTSVINMNDQLSDGETLAQHVEKWKDKAENSVIDYSFHEVIPGNLVSDKIISELPDLLEKGCTSLKLFTAYEDKMMNDSNLYRVIKKASKLGFTILVHAENGQIIDNLVENALQQQKTEPIYHALTRPPFVEAEATNRVLSIAEYTGAKMYIVHVTSAEAMEEVIASQEKGVNVFAETCPQYLMLDDSYLNLDRKNSAKYICSPPLRKKKDQDKLWEGISKGIISSIGSDHCALNLSGPKNMGETNFKEIANGMAGIEDRFLLTYHYGVQEKRIDIKKFVKIVSTEPAKIFGLSQKGSINVGKDADIVILDPNKTKTITEKKQYQNVDHNPYEGIKVKGSITNVFSRGEEIVKDNEYVGSEQRGNFLKRKNV